MLRRETTFYLEITQPSDFRPARVDDPEVELRQARVPCPELNRFFYTAIGGDWFWVDRLAWTYDQWRAWLERPALETWVLSVSGTPAGYFELEGPIQGSVEIVYFGLIPQFTGRGLGGHLLTLAVERAWQKGAARVWLHTSSFDGAAALSNYQKRGFRLYKTEESTKELPDESPGPWPGAQRKN